MSETSTLIPEFRVNSTVFFQIWPRIQFFRQNVCSSRSISQLRFSPVAVLVGEPDEVSRLPAFR